MNTPTSQQTPFPLPMNFREREEDGSIYICCSDGKRHLSFDVACDATEAAYIVEAVNNHGRLSTLELELAQAKKEVERLRVALAGSLEFLVVEEQRCERNCERAEGTQFEAGAQSALDDIRGQIAQARAALTRPPENTQ